MDLVGAPFPNANREPELMARLAATGHTKLGFDSVMPVFSIIQESSALGCKIEWGQKDNWPTVRMGEPIFSSAHEIRIPDDLLEHPDIRCVLDAIRLLRRRFGDEVAVIGKTIGPWSLGYHTFGLEPFSAPRARRSGRHRDLPRPAQGSDDRVRTGPDRGRRGRPDPARPRHR